MPLRLLKLPKLFDGQFQTSISTLPPRRARGYACTCARITREVAAALGLAAGQAVRALVKGVSFDRRETG